MSRRLETYTLAHTARCKLQMAADQPDRNLRFILGHAFTLDKLRLRIAEIETDSSAEIGDSDSDEELPTCTAGIGVASKPRKVSFSGGHQRQGGVTRPKSPPPEELAQLSSSEESEEDEDDDIEEDDEFEEGLGLQRFESATAKAPRVVPDLEEDEGEEDEEGDVGPKSPEMLPNEGDLRVIVGGGDGDEGLVEAYNHVNGCPCHGHKGPGAEKVWEIPGKIGEHGGRLAVVQVGA